MERKNTMKYQTINVDIDSRGIATLLLNRPHKHNAMSAEMMAEIRSATAVLRDNETIRGVILTGAGKSFCAGADLGWMQDNFHRNRQQRIAQSEVLGQMLDELNSLNKLVIARVNGQAFAGGIGLISACDIAIGVSDALFSVTETRLGLTPANISPYLIGRIGASNARRCFLNAHFFRGIEAAKLGLLDKVVAADDLDQAVEQEIEELLACAPQAVAMTKSLIDFVRTRNSDETRQHSAELLADCWEGKEAQSGIGCFFDKMSPPWKI
jgi:methylglutaconyl-CoA hydratase